nr:hypothetical protein [Streptomyces pluripotens]
MNDQPPPSSRAHPTSAGTDRLAAAKPNATAICAPPTTISRTGVQRPTNCLTICAAAIEPTPYSADTAPASVAEAPRSSSAGAM